MINFLVDATLDLNSFSCKGSKVFPIFEAAKFIIVVIQIAVPFGLVIWGSLDWFKALIAHDEKEMRLKRKPFVQRVIAAMIVLVLPWLVAFISNAIASNSKKLNFWTCYSEAQPVIDFSSWKNANNEDDGSILGGFGGKQDSKKDADAKKDDDGFVAPSRTEVSDCSEFNDDPTGCNKASTKSNYCTWIEAAHKCASGSARADYASDCSKFTTPDSCKAGRTATTGCMWISLMEQFKETSPCIPDPSKIY